MDERRRKEIEMRQLLFFYSESDVFSISGENGLGSGEKCKVI